MISVSKRSSHKRPRKGFAKPYDAKKYQGSVPAFASVVAEEMKKWRDDTAAIWPRT